MKLSIGNASVFLGRGSSRTMRATRLGPGCWMRPSAAGYRGIELGPLGYMPEDPAVLGPALAERGLTLIGGVLFRPFHDPAEWDKVRDATYRTCRALTAHGARQLVLIDSISPRRAPTAGRSKEAERLRGNDRLSLLDRLRTVSKIGAEEFGLTVTMHAHAAGFVEFEDELEDVLNAIDATLLGVCLDTGHSVYAGFDPVGFYRRHSGRISYIHFKDVNPEVLAQAIANRTGFYDACAAGVFCTLGDGVVDFLAFKAALAAGGFSGWGTVEQDRDPESDALDTE